MLCCTKEHGHSKCDQYWPMKLEESYFLADFEVMLQSEIEIEDATNLIERKIVITDLTA